MSAKLSLIGGILAFAGLAPVAYSLCKPKSEDTTASSPENLEKDNQSSVTPVAKDASSSRDWFTGLPWNRWHYVI